LDYAPLNSPQFNGNPRGPTPSLSDNDTSLATTEFVKGQGYITSSALSGYATESWVTSQGYLTSSALTGYATESWVTSQGYLTSAPVTSVAGKTGAVSLVVGDVSGAAPLASPALTGNVTITTNSTSPALFVTQTGTGNILTLHDQAGDTTFVAIDQNGKVNTIPSVAASAGFNVPHGAAPTTPVNGDIWTTTGGLFMRQNGTTQQYVDLAGSQTINGVKTFSNANLTLGNATGNGTINVGTGAVISGSTRTINIGTASAAGSTNAINIGGGSGTTTTTLNGTVNATTAAADTNTTQIATTAFVVGQAGSATPLVNGTAAVGTSLRFARQDHVHPTDTSRAALASPTFTGVPAAPTAAVDTNTTQLATTAYVVGQGYLKSATASSTYAPLASAALTGVPTAPTATAGTNTTQLATTAFVTAAVPAFGATADVNDPSSTTKAANIENVRELLLSPGYQMFYQGLGVNGTSGAGAAVNANSGRWKEYVSPNTGVAGHAKGVFDTTSTGIGFAGYQRGANLTSRNWSKKMWISGRCMIGHFSLTSYNGSANTFARISLGGYAAIGAGDMVSTSRGIGWKLQGGGSSALELQVSNGTTVTTVTSSFTPTLKQCFDWEIYSDGAGNVTLYVNDSQVATTTAGPTGTQTNGLYMEGVDTTASSTAPFILNNLGTKIFVAI
jgi:hypothetical protein